MAETALESELTRRWATRPADDSRGAASADARASAAVAVLVAGPHLEVALIRRATDARDPWSGHMALPGGRRDPVDVDLRATATRETLEEVGIDLRGLAPWADLPTVAARSGGKSAGLRVAPFLFRLEARPVETLNHEVAELVWVPLEHLRDGRYASEFEYHNEQGIRRFPAWNVDGRVVWGLTHHILSSLLDVPRGE